MKKLLLTLALVVSLSACSLQRTPFMNTTQLQDVDFSDVATLRKGNDCAYWILGIIGPFGDNSLMEAIKDARIRQVRVVDYSAHYYFLYGKQCIQVYGR